MWHLLKILKNFTGTTTANKNSSKVDQAIEQVIDGIDAKLRLVPSYKQKLRGAVSTALQHIDSLVNQVPGPFDFNHKNYSKDTNVSAYFALPSTMQETFSQSSELQSFFSDINNSDINNCYTLLCANKEEKTILGSKLVDDVIQHDIMQTSVNFFDYKVLSPAPSNSDVRNGIKQCIFDGLITYALQHISNIKIERRDLWDQQRILNARLRSRQSGSGGLSTMLAEGHTYKIQSEEIENQLKQAGKKLETMLEKKDVLSFYLDQVKNILSAPDNFIQLNVSCFRLNNMRIKVDENSDQTANSVCFSEIDIANVMKRVVAVAKYPREEMKFVHSQHITA